MSLNLLNSQKPKEEGDVKKRQQESLSPQTDIQFFKKKNHGFFAKKNRALNAPVEIERDYQKIFIEIQNIFLEKVSQTKKLLIKKKSMQKIIKTKNPFLNFLENSDFVKNIQSVKATRVEESGKVVMSLEISTERKSGEESSR